MFALGGGSLGGAPIVVDGSTGNIYTLKSGTTPTLAGGPVLHGSGAPASTPLQIGALYVDTSGGDLYFAKGVSAASDWILLANV